jgi:hypothetical protein
VSFVCRGEGRIGQGRLRQAGWFRLRSHYLSASCTTKIQIAMTLISDDDVGSHDGEDMDHPVSDSEDSDVVRRVKYPETKLVPSKPLGSAPGDFLARSERAWEARAEVWIPVPAQRKVPKESVEQLDKLSSYLQRRVPEFQATQTHSLKCYMRDEYGHGIRDCAETKSFVVSGVLKVNIDDRIVLWDRSSLPCLGSGSIAPIIREIASRRATAKRTELVQQYKAARSSESSHSGCGDYKAHRVACIGCSNLGQCGTQSSRKSIEFLARFRLGSASYVGDKFSPLSKWKYRGYI